MGLPLNRAGHEGTTKASPCRGAGGGREVSHDTAHALQDRGTPVAADRPRPTDSGRPRTVPPARYPAHPAPSVPGRHTAGRAAGIRHTGHGNPAHAAGTTPPGGARPGRPCRPPCGRTRAWFRPNRMATRRRRRTPPPRPTRRNRAQALRRPRSRVPRPHPRRRPLRGDADGACPYWQLRRPRAADRACIVAVVPGRAGRGAHPQTGSRRHHG